MLKLCNGRLMLVLGNLRRNQMYFLLKKMKKNIASHLSTHFFDCTKFGVWLFLYKELCFKKGALN